MIDLLGLISKTVAFKTVLGDKKNNKLSHAYLIVNKDKQNLLEYLKIFAKTILCKEGSPCCACRACSLIDEGNYPDLYIYPKDKENVLKEDVENLIEESYYKPIEGDKKVFIIFNAQSMNIASQNKLLKTLEEPPQNVIIILGATSEYPLLSTIKSRVKKLEVPPFSDKVLFDALKKECQDEQKLLEAIACGDKTVGRTLALYDDGDFIKLQNLAEDVLVNMQKSSEVLTFSHKITKEKIGIEEFLSVLELRLSDFLHILSKNDGLVTNEKSKSIYQSTTGFNLASVVFILEKITKARKQKVANMNDTMLLEWVLFTILEGKHKWQKL